MKKAVILYNPREIYPRKVYKGITQEQVEVVEAFAMANKLKVFILEGAALKLIKNLGLSLDELEVATFHKPIKKK